jgi:hypothetical protein
MKEINKGLNIIDWGKLGWDYEHKISAHNLRGDPLSCCKYIHYVKIMI